MKNNNKIVLLLRKYYDADISIAEMKELKYLLGETEKNAFINDKILLDYCESEAKNTEMKEDFESVLFKKLDLRASVHPIRILWSGYRKYYSIAATILIITTASLWQGNFFISEGSGIIITEKNLNNNRELALTETKRAFGLISKNLKIADLQIKKLSYANRGFEKLKILEKLNIKF